MASYATVALLEAERKEDKVNAAWQEKVGGGIKWSESHHGGQEIQRSSSMRCLGVVLDDGLTWREQVESIRRKCFAGLAKIRRWSRVLLVKTWKEYIIHLCNHIWITAL